MVEAEPENRGAGRRASGRQGGRAARRALRTAPLLPEEKAVTPGLSAGCYQPLTQVQVETIHRSALNVLEDIGLANAIPSCVERVVAAGGWQGSDGRLRFPAARVEDTLTRAARDTTQDILASHYPQYISRALDNELRALFDIKLDRRWMEGSPPGGA